MGHIEMFPADQFPVANKKHLYHSVVFLSRHGNDVLIFTVGICNFLLLRHTLYAVKKIPVSSRLLIFHVF